MCRGVAWCGIAARLVRTSPTVTACLTRPTGGGTPCTPRSRRLYRPTHPGPLVEYRFSCAHPVLTLWHHPVSVTATGDKELRVVRYSLTVVASVDEPPHSGRRSSTNPWSGWRCLVPATPSGPDSAADQYQFGSACSCSVSSFFTASSGLPNQRRLACSLGARSSGRPVGTCTSRA